MKKFVARADEPVPLLDSDATAPDFRSMVEFAPAYFYVASMDVARTFYLSPQAEAMLGYSAADWKADPNLWLNAVHPDDRDRVLSEFAAGVGGLKRFRAQYRIATKSGGMLTVRDHAAVVPNPSGMGMIIHGVVLDITDLLVAEQAAMSAELERVATQRFLGTMSHELRTPLNSILGFGELLTLKGADPLTERQRRFVANIVTSGKHLLGLVNELLDLTLIQTGELRLKMTSVPLGSALRRAVDTIRPLAAEKGLQIEARLGGPIRVRADAARLHQVLLNLLSNSVKFTTEGLIEVSPSVEGQWVAIAISDSGIGIAERDLERIFDEFVQVGPDHKNTQAGAGLGLPLAHRLVDAMSGTIGATSTVGEGSTFTVRLRRA